MSLVISICVLFYIGFMALMISGLFKHTKLEIKSYETLPSVSVVVAARNEEDHIQHLINDLISQEYPLDKLEVVIVNDRSNDDTAAILEDASDNYAFIKVITIDQMSKDMTPKKNALSKGIEAAVGEIIVLTDADCRVRKLWVSSMAYSVMNKEGISIGFSEIGLQNESFFHRYQKIDFLSIIIANAGFSGWGLFWSGTGQNLAFFKRDFEKIGGFEKVKDRISGDDMYLVQSISKLKPAILHIDPNSFVKTSAMKSVNDFFNQRIRWSSNAKLTLGNEPLFFGFLLTTISFNLLIIGSLLIGNAWIGLMTIKVIFDGLAVFLGSKLFNRTMDFPAYCLWAILQPLYIPLIGFLGIRGKFTWKP